MELPYTEEHRNTVREFNDSPHVPVITDQRPKDPSDWIINVDGEIAGDLLVPANIFAIIRNGNAEINHFDRTEYGPRIGGRHTSEDSDDAGIDVLRESIRFHVHDLDRTRQPDYEAVVNENPSPDAFRTIQKQTRLKIYNIHEHSNRGGLSIYLTDPKHGD